MKFIVTRTSNYSDKPCDEAEPYTYDSIEWRNCTEEYFDQWYAPTEGKWRSIGINHRTHPDKSWIGRTHPNTHEGYAVEINSLDDLLKLIDKYGEVIIQTNMSQSEPSIEIYDDCRE